LKNSKYLPVHELWIRHFKKAAMGAHSRDFPSKKIP
jgi:hypothetical protein